MYIIEFIINKFINKQPKDSHYTANSDDENQYSSCEHIFMPVDSSNEILSCTKCGLLINKNNLSSSNFFKTGI